MKSMAQTPQQEHLRVVIHYLVDTLASCGQGGETAEFGAVQPSPPPPHALKAVCEFLQQSGS